MLTIKVPCPGHLHLTYPRDKETVFCGPDEFESQIVSVGDTEVFEVFLCGHVWMPCSCCSNNRWEAIAEALKDYGPILSARSRNGPFHGLPYAWTGTFGDDYFWDVCPCGKVTSYEWWIDELMELNSKHLYCSLDCWAKGETEARRCGTCGVIEVGNEWWFNHLVKKPQVRPLYRFTPLRKKLQEKLNRRFWFPNNLFCSRKCFFLALRKLLQTEEEERLIRSEKKCVRKVKKLMVAARKSLKEYDPEAWSSLQKEFAQAATLQE